MGNPFPKATSAATAAAAFCNVEPFPAALGVLQISLLQEISGLSLLTPSCPLPYLVKGQCCPRAKKLPAFSELLQRRTLPTTFYISKMYWGSSHSAVVSITNQLTSGSVAPFPRFSMCFQEFVGGQESSLVLYIFSGS